MYKTLYLPTAKRELEEAALYIATELAAPDAAIALLDEIDGAVRKLREMPYRHPIYHALYAMKREVRFFPVKHFNVFYVVDEEHKVIEIQRILYQRRNTTTL